MLTQLEEEKHQKKKKFVCHVSWTDMRSAFEKMRPCMIHSHDHATWRSQVHVSSLRRLKKAS